MSYGFWSVSGHGVNYVAALMNCQICESGDVSQQVSQVEALLLILLDPPS